MAFETWGQDFGIDKDKAREKRKIFSDQLFRESPEEVVQLVASMFPLVSDAMRTYPYHFGVSGSAEKTKRIFHPRYFQQYFQFNVPPRLYSERELREFSRRVRAASEEEAVTVFKNEFSRLYDQEFKRFRFVQKVCELENLSEGVKRGISRGMVQVADAWSPDAFEYHLSETFITMLLSAIPKEDQSAFFERLLRESSLDTLLTDVLWKATKLPANIGQEFRELAAAADLAELRRLAVSRLKAKYCVPSPPNMLDMNFLSGTRLAFGWRALGVDGERSLRDYFGQLFEADPTNLLKYTKWIFHSAVIDEYLAFKDLFDYADLRRRIAEADESVRSSPDVQNFINRYESVAESG
ncbi:MAG TPA: hypothetical protein VGL89_19610 [Candidatus Koribacter sp.]|jgi:hypothetical protein